MLYDQLVNLYTESKDSVLLENAQFIKALRAYTGKSDTSTLAGQDAAEFLAHLGVPSKRQAEMLDRAGVDRQNPNWQNILLSFQNMNHLAYILDVKGYLPEPEPIVGPQGPPGPAGTSASGGSPVTVNVHGGGISPTSTPGSIPPSKRTPKKAGKKDKDDESDHWQTGAAVGGALGAGITGIRNLRPGGAGSEWVTTPAIGAALGAATAEVRHRYKKLKKKHPTLARVFAGSALFAAGAFVPKGYSALRKLQGGGQTNQPVASTDSISSDIPQGISTTNSTSWD
jgi:hypothetical protein